MITYIPTVWSGVGDFRPFKELQVVGHKLMSKKPSVCIYILAIPADFWIMSYSKYIRCMKLRKDTVEAVGFHLRNSTIIWISNSKLYYFLGISLVLSWKNKKITTYLYFCVITNWASNSENNRISKNGAKTTIILKWV